MYELLAAQACSDSHSRGIWGEGKWNGGPGGKTIRQLHTTCWKLVLLATGTPGSCFGVCDNFFLVHRSCILCPSHVFFFAYCPCQWSRPEERKGRKRPTGLGIEKARSATPKRPNRPTTPSSFVSGPVAITSTSYHLHLHPRDWAGAEHLNDD